MIVNKPELCINNISIGTAYDHNGEELFIITRKSKKELFIDKLTRICNALSSYLPKGRNIEFIKTDKYGINENYKVLLIISNGEFYESMYEISSGTNEDEIIYNIKKQYYKKRVHERGQLCIKN